MAAEPTIRRILILDDDYDYRRLLITHLKKSFPHAELVEYDPVARGVPGDDFDWSAYDVLLLDYYLSIHGLTGLDILQANRKNKMFPATLMLTAAGTEEIATKAIRAGVYDFIRKDQPHKHRLASAIQEAFRKHNQQRTRIQEITSQSRAFNKAVFYRTLELAGKSADEKALLLIQLDHPREMEDELGLVFLTNVLRHLSRVCLELLERATTNPSITRLSDTATAIIMDQNGSVETLSDRALQLCESLAAKPYVYQNRSYQYNVSMGIVPLSEVTGTAEHIISLARSACVIASGTPGSSYHIHGTRFSGAVSPGKAKPLLASIVESPPGDGPSVIPVAAIPPEIPLDKPPATESATVNGTADSKLKIVRQETPADQERETPSPQWTPMDRRISKRLEALVQDEAKLDESQLGKQALLIKKAFDENRIVQTFQPVISLFSDSATEAELYMISLQLVTTDGSILHNNVVMQAVETDAFRKFVDRWMLRESIARVINTRMRRTVFLLHLSEASLADSHLFDWLRKHLAGSRDHLPEHSIVPLIPAKGIPTRIKQSEALIHYLKKSYRFGFALHATGPTDDLYELTSKGLFDYLVIQQTKIPELQSLVPVKATGQTLLARLKQEGVRIIADGINDSAMLTEAINLGADYAVGPFVGDELTQLDESTNFESFEIT